MQNLLLVQLDYYRQVRRETEDIDIYYFVYYHVIYSHYIIKLKKVDIKVFEFCS